jgi:hypothetical protein
VGFLNEVEPGGAALHTRVTPPMSYTGQAKHKFAWHGRKVPSWPELFV